MSVLPSGVHVGERGLSTVMTTRSSLPSVLMTRTVSPLPPQRVNAMRLASGLNAGSRPDVIFFRPAPSAFIT